MNSPDRGGLNPPDVELEAVVAEFGRIDPRGLRMAQVLRSTLDQLYDGQRTGRYRWADLYKTEKTHCGALFEINLRREFRSEFQDGTILDYSIAGVEVDCKYSQRMYGWMIPPEAQGHLCLVMWSDDDLTRWSMGLVRVTPGRLRPSNIRDGRVILNKVGQDAILWLFRDAPLPPNVLLQLPAATVNAIMGLKSGTQRINALFRATAPLRAVVGSAAVATVGQQKDFMKRVRANGGARSALQSEGILILGPSGSHADIARGLGVPVPLSGESIAVRVVPVTTQGEGIAHIAGGNWRAAVEGDPVVPAPELPSITGPNEE